MCPVRNVTYVSGRALTAFRVLVFEARGTPSAQSPTLAAT
jgi:hypothetical protein